MAIKYKIHISNQETVEIEAETINVGVNKLWLFDAESNLIGVFRWENIQGFSVEGSASGQKVTDDLLHEKKAVDEQEKAYGPVIAALDRAANQLTIFEKAALNAWVKLYDAKKESKQLEFLLANYPDRLRDGYVKLVDYQRQLQPTMRKLLEDLDGVFPKKK